MSRRILISLIILALAAVSAGGWYFSSRHDQTTGPSQPKPAVQSAAPANQPNSVTPQTYKVSVYFSKHPQSDNDPSATYPVSRTSNDLGLAKFTISELLKGPTAYEKQQGFFTTARLRSATSNCGEADFTIKISGGTATLRFCKPFDHLGVVADGQAESEIKATLKQFASINKVIVLNYQGDCEFNLSGQNLCKQ